MLLIVVIHRLMGLTMPINSTAMLDMRQRSSGIDVRCALKWIARPIQHHSPRLPRALMPIYLSRWTIDLLMIHTGQGLHCLLALFAVRHPLVVTIPPTTRTAKSYADDRELFGGRQPHSWDRDQELHRDQYNPNINLLRSQYHSDRAGYSKPVLSHSPAQNQDLPASRSSKPVRIRRPTSQSARTILMISPCAQMYRPEHWPSNSDRGEDRSRDEPAPRTHSHQPASSNFTARWLTIGSFISRQWRRHIERIIPFTA